MPGLTKKLRGAFWFFVLAVGFHWLMAAVTIASAQSPYPPPARAEDDSQFGAKIQRTMKLLATSTPEHRNRVRILFYGQSITSQKWWTDVADDLRKCFGHADLQIENRAIGGFASQLLVRIAEHDLYPFYPDLLIFHVYGDHRRYEEIIANARRRTTAEIAVYTDHLAATEEADENGAFVDAGWTAFMAKWLVENAEKYGCEVIDIRPDWKRYVKDNKLLSKAVLRDGIHLNDQGNFLLAELVKRHLVYKPQFPADPDGMVSTYALGKDVRFENGRLKLEFTGNRVDLIAANPGGEAAPVKVLIDGKKPSEFPAAYAITRPSAIHNIWPAVNRIAWEKPLVLEEWTLRITESDEMATTFSFEVTGSKTGPDGSGVSGEKFVSESGRVVIEPEDWHMERTCAYLKKAIPKDFEIKWQVVPMFVDQYRPQRIDDPTREYATTVVQGIPNTSHTLELIAEGDGHVPIRAVRVCRPPLK